MQERNRQVAPPLRSETLHPLHNRPARLLRRIPAFSQPRPGLGLRIPPNANRNRFARLRPRWQWRLGAVGDRPAGIVWHDGNEQRHSKTEVASSCHARTRRSTHVRVGIVRNEKNSSRCTFQESGCHRIFPTIIELDGCSTTVLSANSEERQSVDLAAQVGEVKIGVT